MNEKLQSILHYSIAMGKECQVARPSEKRIAVHAAEVSKFAAAAGGAAPAVAMARHPGFSYRVTYFGDSAEIQVYHIDFLEPVLHGAVSWGGARDAERAFGHLMGRYLGYIAADPDGVRFVSDNSPVQPAATAFLCELAAPDFFDIDLEKSDVKALRDFLHALAFNVVDEAATHKQVVMALGDPHGEYPDLVNFRKTEL